MLALTSPFVVDQVRTRSRRINNASRNARGEYVLYWMQSTHRLEENWALRYATIAADRLGLPVIIHQGLDPTYEYASDRIHSFVLNNARELSIRARRLGLTYRFALRRRHADDRRVVDRLASRAALVVTDDFPTCGIAERTQRFAERVGVRVVAVDSHGVIPASAFQKEEWAARTIRPKIAKLLDDALITVRDQVPRVRASDALVAAIDPGWLDVEHADLAREIAACEIDHAVPAVALTPGLDAARRRLDRFCDDSLGSYEERRSEPADVAGSSGLSAYLHFGQISAAEVARMVRERGTRAAATAFLDELVTWRELSLNFCTRNPNFRTIDGLPDWVHRTMREHAADRREASYTLEQLERAETHEPLWNAAQRELVTTGSIHNRMRMYWGKAVVGWTETYADALSHLIHLNNKWALDGRDPSSYGNIQWCFGKFDRPWARRPVYGTMRYMSLALAGKKFDARGYMARVAA